MTKHFAYLVCELWHKDLSFWWHWYVHWHKYWVLRDELRVLGKVQAFADNPLCGAVCMKCFEKCTYWFANLKEDSRNVLKQLRKTVNIRHELCCDSSAVKLRPFYLSQW